MKIQTVFTCEDCDQRIEYDYDLGCYLKHEHPKFVATRYKNGPIKVYPYPDPAPTPTQLLEGEIITKRI